MELADDLVVEYLVECHEGLDRLDQDLIELEQSDDDRAILDSIFRAFHTIKGGAGFFGFARLEKLTHAGEEVLSRLREGEIDLSTDIASGLLALLDTVRKTIACIERERSEGTDDISEVLSLMQGFIQGETVEMAAPIAHLVREAALAPSPAGDEPSPSSLQPEPLAENDGEPEIGPGYIEIFAETDAKRGEGAAAPPAPSPHDAGRERAAAPARPADPSSTARADEHAAAPAGVADTTIRVDVNLLDKLMNLVGELVLARNQILQHHSHSTDKAVAATSQRLNLITTELQESVMKTRMQPVGNIWNRFPRVVRDLALSLGKQVRLEMQGQDTELDKTIIEALKDPLTHIVRNSVDHGIETPAERQRRGKPAEGRLFLRAYHEGGQVNIEITDDGAGIDPERVRRKAIERGLLGAEQASRMSDQEIAQLIFWPGFSTASTITNISGRGVGMDVVKTNIEKIGGVIDLQNQPGHSLTLRIKIPLTLAIIPALMVSTAGDRYAIPQVNLLELVRVDLTVPGHALERIHGTPVYRLRGRLLPLVFLNRALGLRAADSHEDTLSIVVVQADGVRFGLVVESINDTEEIVVKPLSKQLKSIAGYAGATILGDGKVALILDVQGLAQQAGLLVGGAGQQPPLEAEEAAGDEGQKERLLLCRAGRSRRLVIPLADVSRLEEVTSPRIERAGEHDAIQYRGAILPLVHLGAVLGEAVPAASPDKISVVVYSDEQITAGIVVDAILDILEEHLKVKPLRTPGVIRGSAIIHGEVTDILDVRALIANGLGSLL